MLWDYLLAAVILYHSCTSRHIIYDSELFQYRILIRIAEHPIHTLAELVREDPCREGCGAMRTALQHRPRASRALPLVQLPSRPNAPLCARVCVMVSWNVMGYPCTTHAFTILLCLASRMCQGTSQ